MIRNVLTETRCHQTTQNSKLKPICYIEIVLLHVTRWLFSLPQGLVWVLGMGKHTHPEGRMYRMEKMIQYFLNFCFYDMATDNLKSYRISQMYVFLMWGKSYHEIYLT